MASLYHKDLFKTYVGHETLNFNSANITKLTKDGDEDVFMIRNTLYRRGWDSNPCLFGSSLMFLVYCAHSVTLETSYLFMSHLCGN